MSFGAYVLSVWLALTIGTMLGVTAMAIVAVAKRADEELEREPR